MSSPDLTSANCQHTGTSPIVAVPALSSSQSMQHLQHSTRMAFRYGCLGEMLTAEQHACVDLHAILRVASAYVGSFCSSSDVSGALDGTCHLMDQH